MKLLLTNDDGIDAPGLAALQVAAARLGEVIVAAPAEGHSGCSHRITTGQPIGVERRGAGLAILGTPADCVRLAFHGLTPPTDWVLSGINAGGNLGADVHHSGTVAAIREAVLHGRPGIAVSQYQKRGQAIDWDRAARWTARLLHDLMARPWQPGFFWNINLPHLAPADPDPEVVFCPLDPGPIPLGYRQEGDHWHYDADYHQRPRQEGSDVAVCFAGRIAVTRIVLFEAPA